MIFVDIFSQVRYTATWHTQTFSQDHKLARFKRNESNWFTMLLKCYLSIATTREIPDLAAVCQLAFCLLYLQTQLVHCFVVLHQLLNHLQKILFHTTHMHAHTCMCIQKYMPTDTHNACKPMHAHHSHTCKHTPKMSAKIEPFNHGTTNRG